MYPVDYNESMNTVLNQVLWLHLSTAGPSDVSFEDSKFFGTNQCAGLHNMMRCCLDPSSYGITPTVVGLWAVDGWWWSKKKKKKK